MIPCPSCQASIQDHTRFCPECGSKVPGPVAGAGLSIGNEAKVVASGDISGVKNETKVSGNMHVTNVTNQDASKAVHKCAISGEHVLFTDLNECPQCRLQVSSKYFDVSGMRCVSCRDLAEAELKAAIEERLSNDGIIDAQEQRELIQIQTRLKISQKRNQEIEKLARENLFAKHRQDSAVGKTAVPGIGKKLEAATRAIAESKAPLAIKLLEPAWNECRDNRDYRDVYLGSLLIFDPEKLEQELAKFAHEELSVDLLRVRVFLAKAQAETAYRLFLNGHLKAIAYRDKIEWSLLPVEIASDKALFEEEEDLANHHLSEAEHILGGLQPMEGVDTPTPVRFILDYVELIRSSSRSRPKVAEGLTKMISDAGDFSDEPSSDWFKYIVLCSSKLKLLERAGVHLAPQASPAIVPSQSAQPSQKKCPNCGNMMPAAARFCGSCGYTVAKVNLFLEEIRMEQYVDLFANNRIDESIITELSEQDLKNIGITSLGHRKKIFSAISEYDW